MVRSFIELFVYRQALQLAGDIFEITKKWPPEERYSLTDQIRRAGRLISLSIAEAWGKRRYHAHFVSKLTDAQAEAYEVQACFDHASGCGYMKADEVKELNKSYDQLVAGLVKMTTDSARWCGPSILREKQAAYTADVPI